MLAAFSALVVELGIWFVPQLLRASREPAYSVQFCLVLDIETYTALITVSFLILYAVPSALILQLSCAFGWDTCSTEGFAMHTCQPQTAAGTGCIPT